MYPSDPLADLENEHYSKDSDLRKRRRLSLFDEEYEEFISNEYTDYMELIKETSPPAYENMITSNGEDLFLQTLRTFLDSERTRMDSPVAENEDDSFFINPLITNEERAKVLKVINKLAPKLYEKIIAVDPTGEHHIKRGDTAIRPLLNDGLPEICVSPETTEITNDELSWIFGHELSHYIHDDFDMILPIHKAIGGHETAPQAYAPGKKVLGQLPFAETLRNAKSRAQEYAADAGSVLYFGTNIDAGLDLIKKWGKEEIYENPRRETFKRTHPLSNFGRKEHLESLRSEVERRKASGQKPAPIDWDTLIDYYKNKMWKPLTESTQP